MKRKFDASIGWLENGIEYYRNLLRRMMHKEIRKVYRENALEFEKAIKVLKQESVVKKPGVTEEWSEDKYKEWVDGYWKLGAARNTIKLFEYTRNFIRSLVEGK